MKPDGADGEMKERKEKKEKKEMKEETVQDETAPVEEAAQDLA